MELKSIISEMVNSLEGSNRIFDQAEERISELEYREIEVIQSEEQKEVRSRRKNETGGIPLANWYMHHKSPRRRREKKEQKADKTSKT